MTVMVDLKRLPESALYGITMIKRNAYIRAIAPLLDELLTEHGPMPAEALRYFAKRAYGWQLSTGEYEMVLANRRSMFRKYEDFYDSNCWYTVQQIKDNVEPSVPIPEDYTEAYYELVAFVRLVQQHPEYASAPPEQLRALGVI